MSTYPWGGSTNSNFKIPCKIRFFKTTPIMTLRNPYTGSEVLEMSFSISADVYSDLSIGLALKHYPKVTLDTLKSVHWIRSYGDIFFHVSWYIQWPHHRIGLKKLSQKEPSCWNWSTGSKVIMIFPSCQLICTAVQLIWPHH